MTLLTSLTCSISNTSLGKVLVASSATGICALYVSDQTDTLLTTLTEDFPLADTLLTRLTELPGPAADWHQAALDIVIGLEAQQPPLNMDGTDFQHRVWQQLQTIPAGTTLSYSELANAIGNPNAVRAAASACAANKIAILIPCHRVKRKSGDSGGYRWGLALKQSLLERELLERELNQR